MVFLLKIIFCLFILQLVAAMSERRRKFYPPGKRPKKDYALVETLPTEAPITLDTLEEVAHKIGQLLMPQEQFDHRDRRNLRGKRDTDEEKITLEDLEKNLSEVIDPVESSVPKRRLRRRKREQ